MTPRWELVQDVLISALELEADGREDFVRSACGADSDLFDEVMSLLDRHDTLGFLDAPTTNVLPLTHPVREGTRLARYEIIEKLDDGGMGIVYKARDTKLDRFVALKFLLPHLMENEEARSRFRREALAISSLDHPNICTVHEVGEGLGNEVFIVMTYYEGETLAAVIERGPVAYQASSSLMSQVGEGLACAHEAGIIHRDIKPGNLLVTDRGRVKILDFGIAKVAGLATTITAGTVGTLAYMSPEQLDGLSLDRRTDIWSMGVVLYELLTGTRPFKGDYHAAVIRSILNDDPVRPSSLNPQIPVAADAIVQRALEKNRANRYDTADGFLEDLRGLAKGIVISGPSGAHGWGLTAVVRRRSALVAFLLVLVVVVAAIVLGNLPSKLSGDRSPAVPDRLGAPGVVAIFPFADVGSDSTAREGSLLARQVSQQLFNAVTVTSVDYNSVLARTSGRAILDPAAGRALTKRLSGEQYVLGTLNRVTDMWTFDGSLYDGDARLVARLAADRPTIDDLADALLHQLLVQWEPEPVADHIRKRYSIDVAGQTTNSGAALKQFVLAFYSGEFDLIEDRLRRAIEIDSTFAMAAFIKVREDVYVKESSSSNRAVRLLLRYRHKLPVVERGLTEIYAGSMTFEQKRRKYVELLNLAHEDGALWNEYGEVLFHDGYKHGRRTVEALGPLTRARDLTGSPRYILADIGLLEKDRSLVAEYSDHERTASDSTGRYAFWYEAALKDAAARDDVAAFDLLLSDYQRFHPIRLVAAAARIGQYGKDTVYPRRIAQLLMNAPDLTQDWQEFGRYSEAEMDVASGHLRRGTEKFLALADDNPSFLLHAVLPHFGSHVPADSVALSDLAERVQRWDTLSADWPFMARDPHTGSYEELKAFLSAVIAYKQGDMSAFDMYRRAVANRAAVEGHSSLAAAMRNTLDAWRSWRMGLAHESLAILDTAQVHYQPTTYAYHSWVADQMLDRYLRAEISYALGQYEEALTWYLSLNDRGRGGFYGMWAIAPVFFFEGDIYERLGEPALAARNYRRLVEFWSDADPELRYLVDEAEKRLSNLTAS